MHDGGTTPEKRSPINNYYVGGNSYVLAGIRVDYFLCRTLNLDC